MQKVISVRTNKPEMLEGIVKTSGIAVVTSYSIGFDEKNIEHYIIVCASDTNFSTFEEKVSDNLRVAIDYITDNVNEFL